MPAQTPAAQQRAFGEGIVHLWNIDLDEVAAGELGDPRLLSRDERETAGRMADPSTRIQFVAARNALREILAGYLGVAAGAIAFEYGPFGKPCLAGRSSSLHFNLSHADAVALVAVSGSGDVGVDVERIRPVPEWQDIASAWLTGPELGRMASLPEDLRCAAFIRSWTCTEAILKALGYGWAGAPALAAPAMGSKFWALEVETAPGYAAALALRRPGCIVSRDFSQR